MLSAKGLFCLRASLKPLNWIWWNLIGSKISMSATKFVFFEPIRKPRCGNKCGTLYSGARYVALWASCLHDLVSYKNNSYNFRYQNTAEVPRTRTTRYGLQSFSYRAATIWNSLPNEAREMSNFNQFRNFINIWDGPDCRCNACRTQVT